METKNITLSLPRDLLRKAKLLAVEKETSVSGLLRELLTELVSREDAYEKSWRKSAARLEAGLDLGTNGSVGWSREEVHER